MASPTRRAPPAPLRPPARRSAAPLRALARQNRLGAAASPASTASPGPSASSGRLSLTLSLPPRSGIHENKGKEKCFFFSVLFVVVVGRAGVLRLLGLLPPARTHLRSRREGWGWGLAGLEPASAG